MDPLVLIGAANAAFALIEALIPQIAAMVGKGEISVEQQKAILDKYNSLKKSVEDGFTGPEWDLSTKE